MPDFAWRAANSAGKITTGYITAMSVPQAMKQLRDKGLHPLNVKPVAGGQAAVAAAQPDIAVKAINAQASKTKLSARNAAVNSADILALTSELTIMLRSGLALDNALKVLIDMSHKPAMRELVRKLLEDVKGGMPFSKALAVHPQHFNEFYINMVRSGEVSGQMSGVLARLVEHMERLRALRESVISATIYPLILLTVAVLTLIVLLGFVVPRFEAMFADAGDTLPVATRILMWVGDIFRSWWWLFAALAIALVFGAVRWFKTPEGKHWLQGTLLRLPLIGPLAAKYQMTLFARSWGTLLGNGVPMLTALSIATDTVSNSVMRAPLAKVAPVVKEGGRVVEALKGTGLFEPLAINLIRVGEETGRVGAMSMELADILNRQVETGIKRLLTLLEPVIILVLGVLVAFIVISLMMGILSVNDIVG